MTARRGHGKANGRQAAPFTSRRAPRPEFVRSLPATLLVGQPLRENDPIMVALQLGLFQQLARLSKRPGDDGRIDGQLLVPEEHLVKPALRDPDRIATGAVAALAEQARL